MATVKGSNPGGKVPTNFNSKKAPASDKSHFRKPVADPKATKGNTPVVQHAEKATRGAVKKMASSLPGVKFKR